MSSQPESQCGACAHFRSPFSRTDGDFSRPPFCAAFPEGIPDAVYGNRVDHRQPVDGDHGVRWESDGNPYPEQALAAVQGAMPTT